MSHALLDMMLESTWNRGPVEFITVVGNMLLDDEDRLSPHMELPEDDQAAIRRVLTRGDEYSVRNEPLLEKPKTFTAEEYAYYVQDLIRLVEKTEALLRIAPEDRLLGILDKRLRIQLVKAGTHLAIHALFDIPAVAISAMAALFKENREFSNKRCENEAHQATRDLLRYRFLLQRVGGMTWEVPSHLEMVARIVELDGLAKEWGAEDAVLALSRWEVWRLEDEYGMMYIEVPSEVDGYRSWSPIPPSDEWYDVHTRIRSAVPDHVLETALREMASDTQDAPPVEPET